MYTFKVLYSYPHGSRTRRAVSLVTLAAGSLDEAKTLLASLFPRIFDSDSTLIATHYVSYDRAITRSYEDGISETRALQYVTDWLQVEQAR